MKIQRKLFLILIFYVINACSPLIDNSASIPAPTYTPMVDTVDSESALVEEVKAVIDMEVKGAVEQDLLLLESLYAPNAVIIDHRGTIHDTSDDRIIEGWENIKQQHYVGFFSFYDWKSMILVDLNINVTDNKAIAMHKGVIADGEYYKDIGIYTLERFDDRWLITQLEFGNE